MPLPRIDQNSEQGLELQKVVQTKLKDFLGAEYADDVLPLYIVVMLAHGNNQALVTENLEAFLGANDAAEFAKWLFAHIEEHGDKYAVPEPEAALEDDPAADDEAAGDGEREEAGEGNEPAAGAASPADEKQEHGREGRHGAIEWRGESSRHHRSERPREDKRGRDEPSRLERRSSHHRDREAVEEGRDAKRRRRDMRELRPLDAGREDRVRDRDRDRPRNDERPSREERDRERHEWERQQRREAQMAQVDREREYRDHREERDRDRDRGRDRPRDRDREPDRRPRQRAYMDSYEHEPVAPAGSLRRRENDERADYHDDENGRRQNGHDAHAREAPPTVKSQVEPARREPEADDEAEAARGNVFDRLGRRRAALSPAAARKSVFDRLRGNRMLAPKQEVDPEAVTDDELEEGAPSGPVTQGRARTAPHPAATIAAKALNGIKKPAPSQGKADDLAQMKRKMLELQEQVRLLEAQQRTGALAGTMAAPGAIGAVGPAAAPLSLPPVDPRSVHVQGVSPLAVPEVIAAHFSGCGRVINVTIGRDMQGMSRGFAHVEFSNELEAHNALLLSGSILLQQPITVTPKMNRPPPSLTPHYGRGRGGFGPAAFPGAGRGVPFSPRGGGTFRGRGRAPQPLTNHKYVRPELRAELEKQKSGAGLAVAASADTPTG